MNIWENKSLANLKGERWKPVVGFEKTHKVSNYGRVKGVAKYVLSGCIKKPLLRPKKILTQTINYWGYCKITIQHNKIRHCTVVHRLVAKAFIDNSKELPDVNHKDGDKKNNLKKNLEWMTKGDNQRHALRLGLKKKRYGDDHHKHIISDKDAVNIIIQYRKAAGLKYKFPLQNKLAVKYGVAPKTVQQIALGFKRGYLQERANKYL